MIQAAPAVFSTALNQDGTINSPANPAPAGTIVSIFATGLGPITPAVADGTIIVPPLPTNTLGLLAWANPPANPILPGPGPATVAMAVMYAGPAPFEVAGLSQINLQIPADLTTFVQVGAYISVANTSGSFLIYVGSTN